MNKKSHHLIKILLILIFINLILSGCGGSSYEGSSEPRANVEPIAIADVLTVSEDSSIELLPQILLNDTDEDGDNLSPRFLTSPKHGEISTLKGKYKYIPEENFNGKDQIDYEVSDGYGGTSSATISLNISPVNDFPTAVNDDFVIEEDSSSSLDVLSNDIDIDNDSLSLVSVSLVNNGYASVDSISNTVRVTPFAHSEKSVSFVYTATDGNGGYSMGSVVAQITPVNDAPVAKDDVANTQIDTSVIIDVLDNDDEVDEGDSLSIVGIRDEVGGSAVIQNDSILVTPDANSYQPISFVYEISDKSNALSTASVNVSIDCDTYRRLEIEFVCIKAGSFEMGTPTTSNLEDSSDESPVTTITITKDFYLSKYEITKGDWVRIRGDNWPLPSTSSNIPSDSHPAINVSWNDINEVNGFLDDINLRVGCDTSLLSSDVTTRYDPSNVPSGCFRLPTEAEWEFAARAGTLTRYSFGDDEAQLGSHAWFDQNSSASNRVGQKTSNLNDLFDIHGNVREWVFDRYSDSTYTGIAQSDPIGVLSGFNRVLRGGSYVSNANNLRSARRDHIEPTHRSDTTGFRLVFVR